MSERLRALIVVSLAVAAFAPAAAAGGAVSAAEGGVTSTDHYVRHRSSIPVITGQPVQLYVREKVAAESPPSQGVVLFVHGGTYPSETVFDLPYRDYSWMDRFAEAGLHVFSVDMEGYGRSTRPWPMEDPCNLTPENQQILIPDVLAAPCEPSYPFALTTNRSDRDALNSVVDWIRERTGVERVSFVGWSQGGTRTGGYASQYPEKVDKLVELAPGYARDSPDEAPRPQPAGAPFAIQTQSAFTTRWNAQATCEDQVDPAAQDAVWQQNMAFDPVGATWVRASSAGRSTRGAAGTGPRRPACRPRRSSSRGPGTSRSRPSGRVRCTTISARAARCSP
jgi:pimeloyl-ACP methyl ester carboxylesterase